MGQRERWRSPEERDKQRDRHLAWHKQHRDDWRASIIERTARARATRTPRPSIVPPQPEDRDSEVGRLQFCDCCGRSHYPESASVRWCADCEKHVSHDPKLIGADQTYVALTGKACPYERRRTR